MTADWSTGQGRDDGHVVQRHDSRRRRDERCRRSLGDRPHLRDPPTGTSTTAQTAPCARRTPFRARTSTCSRMRSTHAPTNRRRERLICQNYIRNVTQNSIDRATGDYNAFWDDRNYMKHVANVHAAALIAHGNRDLNVMTKNFDQFYAALRAQGVPHQLYFHRDGHGGSPPRRDDQPLGLRATSTACRTASRSEPRAWVVREANACPPRETTATGDQSNIATLTVADTSRLVLGFTRNDPADELDGDDHDDDEERSRRSRTRRTSCSSSPVATAVGQKVANGAPHQSRLRHGRADAVREWPDPGASVANVNFTTGGLAKRRPHVPARRARRPRR